MTKNAPAILARPGTTATLGRRRSAVRSANGMAAVTVTTAIRGIFDGGDDDD